MINTAIIVSKFRVLAAQLSVAEPSAEFTALFVEKYSCMEEIVLEAVIHEILQENQPWYKFPAMNIWYNKFLPYFSKMREDELSRKRDSENKDARKDPPSKEDWAKLRKKLSGLSAKLSLESQNNYDHLSPHMREAMIEGDQKKEEHRQWKEDRRAVREIFEQSKGLE